MNSSYYATSGYNPWSDNDRHPAGVQLTSRNDVVSQIAAERYALLKAVADLKAAPERKARRRPVWRRVRSAATKTA